MKMPLAMVKPKMKKRSWNLNWKTSKQHYETLSCRTFLRSKQSYLSPRIRRKKKLRD